MQAVRKQIDEKNIEPLLFVAIDQKRDTDLISAIGDPTLEQDGQPIRYANCDIRRRSDAKPAELRTFAIQVTHNIEQRTPNATQTRQVSHPTKNRPASIGHGPRKLPELDSNQQPSG